MLARRALLAALAAAPIAGRAAARPAAVAAPHDLTGTWTNGWYTWLRRPKELKTLVLTPAEAEAFEAPRRRLRGDLRSPKDELGQSESEFPDGGPGLARIRGEIRSSWITDPPDGQIPYTPAAKARIDAITKAWEEDFDNVERRDTDERCITNGASGPPLTNEHDTNLIQIVQTRDWVAIVTERNHDIRIVRIAGPDVRAQAGPAGPGQAPAQLWGVSVGRWDGATLVVETTRQRPGLSEVADHVWLSDRSRVTERFTRTGPAEITYAFEVEDASLFTQPWRGEEVFRPAEGRMFEYACHEGNYALPGILAGGRRADRGK